MGNHVWGEFPEFAWELGDAGCQDGAQACEGDFVVTCIGGAWQKAASQCWVGCLDGACLLFGARPATLL